MTSIRLLTHAVALALGFTGACVWTNGNPELAPPRIVDGVWSAPAEPAPPIGWSSTIAPTNDEAERLAALREAALAHRVALPGVRMAEDSACGGLADDDRDVSPFFHARDILDVVPLYASGGPNPGRIEGAVVTFRRAEGLTVGRLQGLLDCQTARDAALDDRAPENRWCPLAVPGALSHAQAGDRGVDVRVAAGDRDAAADVYLRAVALLRNTP
jgi:hypothetical protein